MSKYILILALISCTAEKYDVRVSNSMPKAKKVLISEFTKRDVQLSQSFAFDLANLIRYEFIKEGFQTNFIGMDSLNTDDNVKVEELGQLPESLRNSAGEFIKNNKTSLFDPEKISSNYGSDNFSYLIHGSISRYDNQIILEPENNFLIVLDVYDNFGKHLIIATATFTSKENNHPKELKEVASKLVSQLKINNKVNNK